MTVGLLDLPAEVWLLIALDLGPADLLAVKFTTIQLHALLTEQARHLTNTLIATKYSAPASILNTTLGAHGWLIPTHSAVLLEEKRTTISRNGCVDPDARDRRIRNARSPFLSFGVMPSAEAPSPAPVTLPVPPTSIRWTKISRTALLTEPGPQYLYFLANQEMHLCIARDMFLRSSPIQDEKFVEWVGLYVVRKALDRLRALREWDEGKTVTLSRSISSSIYETTSIAEADSLIPGLKDLRKALAWYYA